MAQTKSISLSQFTTTVQGAVKAAIQKHPKFKAATPESIEFSYLIRGIPVPDGVLAHVTLAETQAYANEIAAHVSGAHQGAIHSIGGHVIVGIPAVDSFVLEK